MTTDLATVSPALLVGIVILGIIQVSLLILALVVWFRSKLPTFGGISRYIWLVLILLISIIGPILFLIIGGKDIRSNKLNQTSVRIEEPDDRGAASTVHKLYGGPRD